MNFDNFNVHCVAGALKKYLRELPNPVIPVEMYNQFIDAASKSSQIITHFFLENDFNCAYHEVTDSVDQSVMMKVKKCMTARNNLCFHGNRILCIGRNILILLENYLADSVHWA